MGLADELRGSKVCIDTAPFIYFIEKHPKYMRVIRPVFAHIDTGQIQAITSTITLLEVLVHPYRKKDKALAERYQNILLNSSGLTTLEISHEISKSAASLRASYSIRTPDAIQIAAGLAQTATSFLTNDPDLKKVSEIRVLVLDDYLHGP